MQQQQITQERIKELYLEEVARLMQQFKDKITGIVHEKTVDAVNMVMLGYPDRRVLLNKNNKTTRKIFGEVFKVKLGNTVKGDRAVIDQLIRDIVGDEIKKEKKRLEEKEEMDRLFPATQQKTI